MPITIGSNIAAVRGTRQLDQSSGALARVFERLSSGARMNRASDDAAGLAVASQLSAKSRVLARARLNLADAASLMSIADSGMGQISQILTRMQELAAQAASGTFGSIQRQSLDREYQQLDKEIQRISFTTSFNGIKLFDGGISRRSFTEIESNSGGLTLTASSVDGSFVVYQDDTSAYVVENTETGERRVLTNPAGYTISSARALANGDVVFSASSGSARDLFRFNRLDGTVDKLTTSSSSDDAGFFEVSQDGSTVAFTSRTLYQDGGTATSTSGVDGLFHLTTINLESGVLRQTADGQINQLYFFNIRLSSDGRYVARQGLSNDFGWYDTQSAIGSSATNVATPSVAPTLRAVTNEGKLYLSATGNLFGLNSTGLLQIFEYDLTYGTARRTSNFDQSLSISDVSVNSQSGALFFTATGNYTGFNQDGVRQVFRLGLSDGSLSQLTSATSANNLFSGSSSRVISADGGKVFALRSGATIVSALDITAADVSLNFEAGFGASGSIAASVASVFSAIRGLGAYALTSRSSASYVLDRMGASIEVVAAARGVVGAALSRIGIAEALTVAQRDEVLGAEKRITDADVAENSSELARLRILQSVGSALLAQANQQPALALNLISSI